MRRPFLWIGASFALGIFVSRGFLIPPIFPFYLLLTLIPVIPFCRRETFFVWILLMSFFLLGGMAEGTDRLLPHDHIAHLEMSGRMALTGKIASFPEANKKGKREILSFVLELRDVYFEKRMQKVSGKVQVFFFNPGISLEYGDTIRLWGELKIPDGRTNPGQFDYRHYLANDKIHRIFRGFGPRNIRLFKKGSGSVLKAVFHLRHEIMKRIEHYISFPESEILASLLIGMRKKIPEEIRDDFARTGTTHILAVSGLNVSIVGGLLYFLLRLARFPQKLNAFVSLVFIGVYVLISGYNAPVLRAGIMGVILMGGLVMEKESELLNSLAVAFLALLFFKPQNLFSASFQLSFLSVLAIFLILPRMNTEWLEDAKSFAPVRKPSFFKEMARFYKSIFFATLAATLGTFPLVLYYFKIASPISFLSNLAIVPLMNLATFSGFLILPSFFMPADFGTYLKWIPLLAIKVSLGINHLLAQIPFASFYTPSPPLYLLWFYYGGVLILLLLPKEMKKWLGSKWLLSAFFLSAIFLAVFVFLLGRDDLLRIHVLHLNRGQVAFFEFPGRTMNLLVNTGKGKPQDEWKWVVKPFLMSRGVQALDAIMLTSFYENDAGGLRGLTESFRCRSVLLPGWSKSDSRKRREMHAFLKKKKIQMHFLSKRARLEGFPRLKIQWEDSEESSLLRVEYENKRGLLVFRGSPDTQAEDFVIHFGKFTEARTFEISPRKPQVESFPMK